MQAGQREFMEKGFQDASLRQIAQAAGVTTGAICGYYADKAALFEALVEPAATDFRALFESVQAQFAALSARQQIESMRGYTTGALQTMLDYVYEHFDAFRLIIGRSAGTVYAGYIDTMVAVEVRATRAFVSVMEAEGYEVPQISDNLMHILSNAYFSAIFETVEHQMAKAEADAYVGQLAKFFWAGWLALLPLR